MDSLVGGKALADMSADRWSWAHYLLRRLTRLLIVIVPALFATAVLDHLGIRWTGGAGYDGAFYDVYSSGPNTARPLIYSPITLLGNIAFLQTIYVPVFGSNIPKCGSLANEFWYYIVFPLASSLFLATHSLMAKLIALTALIFCATFLPWGFLEGGLIWGGGRLGRLDYPIFNLVQFF